MSACLVIRAPNQKLGDQPIDCPLDWSVQQLKLHLSKVYPSRPRPEDQKLIYSGQLLENQMSLRDVFKLDSGKTHILHLVCRPSRESPETSHSPIPLIAAGSVTSMPSGSSVGSGVSSASNDGLRHRSTSAGQDAQQSVQNAQFPVQFPGFAGNVSSPEQMMQQMAVAQQLYAQYFTQYMRIMNQGGAVRPVPRGAAVAGLGPQVPAAVTPPAAAVAPPNNAAAVAPRVAQDNRGPRMNAQGGPLLDEEDDDVARRDWLDWIYTVSRATILLGIVYFYSSFGRFLVVTGIAVLVYMYQGGWFAVQRREDRNRAREAANNHDEGQPMPAQQALQPQAERQAPQERLQGDAGARHLEEMMDRDHNENAPATAAVVPPPEPAVSPITMVWTFITTFFTSLIPEPPPPVNVN